jgi:hypothetical protein
MRNTTFDFYRYQIIPRSQEPFVIDGQEYSVDELKAQKNRFFQETVATEGLVYIDSFGTQLRYRILRVEENRFYMKLGKEKEVTLNNRNLQPVNQTDYPSVWVLIDNEPDRQIIAISRDSNAFGNTNAVSNILERNFTNFLGNFNLQVLISPILHKKDFWALIRNYDQRIERLEFLLIRPNMANISGTFKDEIRDLTDSTNSALTRVQLNAPEDQVLENINQDNERIAALADYAVQGGAQHIKVKLKGVKKVIKTEKTISNVSIESLELEGDHMQVTEVFNRILNNE